MNSSVLESPKEFDIPVDWLYKGKKRSRSTHQKPQVRDPSTTIGKIKTTDIGGSNSSKEGRVARSNSVSNAAIKNAKLQRSNGLKRTNSLSGHESNESKENQTQTHNHSQTHVHPPRKGSIIGTIFGRRSSSSTSSKRPIIFQNDILDADNKLDSNAIELDDEKASTSLTKPYPTNMNTSEKVNHLKELIPLSSISDISLKRVVFAVDKFESDPPQQLPSRNPRHGDILIPADVSETVPEISNGIHSTSTVPAQSFAKDSFEYKKIVEIHELALKLNAKHEQEAHIAAKRISQEVESYNNNQANSTKRNIVSQKPTSTNEGLDHINDKISKFNIDMPIHVHEHHFEEDTNAQELTLDVIYTRCCHLREILPIPATLKQLKDKTAPLQKLKFLNPKPTLIDILSFADFISITPIHTLVFDNVQMTPQMFKVILSSLVLNPVLEKLSLKNVMINHTSWQILCKFLLTCKTLTKLDLSQTKYKVEYDENIFRHNMNWYLMAEVLRKRTQPAYGCQPLEELLLNGIQFETLTTNEPKAFEMLLDAFSMQQMNFPTPIRLGLSGASYANLSTHCWKILLNWMSVEQNNVQGVDTSHNDISNSIKTIVSKLSALSFPRLMYFTLNSTNIPTANELALLLKQLSKLPNLKFLDIGNLPDIFPDVLPYLHKYLPRFPALQRIHLDNIPLVYQELSVMCNILLKCEHLTHISMMTSKESPTPSRNSLSTNESDSTSNSQRNVSLAKNNYCASLFALVRDCPKLIALEVDYSDLDEEIQSRIALSLMRNMRRNIDSTFQLDELSNQDDLLYDGSLITMSAEGILEKLNRLGDTGTTLEKTDATKRYLLKKYLDKLQKLYHNVQQTIDSLFEKRKLGELPLEEKENLLRLLMLEKNLFNILEIFANFPHMVDVLGSYFNNSSLPGLRHMAGDDSDRVATRSANSNGEVTAGASDYHTSGDGAALSTNPHEVATESGRTIDVTTGKPVLMKHGSSLSLIGKKQEEEEGELHKWGFFVQQQNSIYPDNEHSAHQSLGQSASVPASPKGSSGAAGTITLLSKVPSGNELRSAIIEAKGIDSIDDLIKKVNQNNVKLGDIYGSAIQKPLKFAFAPDVTPVTEDMAGLSNEKNEGKVTETYDKILNTVLMDRPNKS